MVKGMRLGGLLLKKRCLMGGTEGRGEDTVMVCDGFHPVVIGLPGRYRSAAAWYRNIL